MFDDLEMGEYIEETPSSEVTEQFETTEEVDGNVADIQTEAQGNILDATQVEGTVPLSVVEAIRTENKAIKEERDRILHLLLEGKSQATQPEVEKDEFANMDPDEILTAGQVFKILEKKDQQIQARNFSEAQAQRERKLSEYETTFRTTNADYDESIKVLPPNIIQSLYATYQDPQELVNIAYKMAKALKGESATSTPNTVKAKVDLENKINSNLNNPKTLSQAKGTSQSLSDAEQLANKIWESL